MLISLLSMYFLRFKNQINWAFLENINFSHVLSLLMIFEFSSYFFLLFVSAFFLAASVNSSCHNFSSKHFCSFELSCGCFVLSNAMWVVLGARSCHWVVFEKSAVLQLNELFWVIILFLADAQDTSTIVSSALWNNTKGAIHNRRFTTQTLIKLLVANGLRHERVGSWQKSDKTLFTSFMDGLQDPLRPHLLGKNIICLLPSWLNMRNYFVAF